MVKKGKKKKQQDKQGALTSTTTSDEPSQSQSTSQQQRQQQRQQQQLQKTEPQKKISQQAPQLQGAWARRQQQQMSTHSQQQQQIPTHPSSSQQQMPTHSSQQQSQGIWTQSQRQQQQMPMSPPQQQQQQIPIHPSSSQQQMPTHSSQQQSQETWTQSQQQQRQIPINTLQQQQEAWIRPPQQQQQVPMNPLQQQQQGASDRSQQQQQWQTPMNPLQQQQQEVSDRSQQQQKIPINPPQQQQHGAWVRPPQQQLQVSMNPPQQLQQGASDRSQQQQEIPMSPPQQQQQAAWIPPQQQQQQIPINPPQQQQQGAWIRPPQQQLQVPINPPQQQQQQRASDRSQQQQQIPMNLPQQQQQRAWIRPPQQQLQMLINPPQQQQQRAWIRQLQQQLQVPMNPLQQQQGALDRSQQQQQQMPMSPPQQQQQEAWIQPSQQQLQVPMNPLQQQQGALDQLQQQQLQQMPMNPPQQLQQGASDRSQQQQEIPMSPPQQQQQAAWIPSQQQQRQIPINPPQQQQQGAWIRPPQQQLQVPINPPQQQQGASDRSQLQQQQIPMNPAQQQQQRAWIRPPQQQLQMPINPPQQQQQGTLDRLQQQQHQMPISLPQQQQQGASDRSQQQQQMPMNPPQQQQGVSDRSQQQRQQVPMNPPQQQQAAWISSQQQQLQIPINPPQQQQGASDRSQLQQQQILMNPAQQQQQRAWIRPPQQQLQVPINPPQQQQQQGASDRSQQQQQKMPINLPQQQLQVPMNPPQQQQQEALDRLQQQQHQMPISPPQQQQQGASDRSQQQQQMPMNPPQQQQGASNRSQQQQQQVPMNRPQQQLQGSWIRPLQQQRQTPMCPPQKQQQGAWGQSQQQQQQRVSGNSQQTQAIKQDSFDTQQSQSSTSAKLFKLSELCLRDNLLQSTKTSTNTKMISSAIKEHQLCIPKRQYLNKGGTLGTSIKVLTNMFEISFPKNFVTNAVHYDVSITPKVPKLLNKKIFEICRSTHFPKRYPAYDGKKNAYSANDLPLNNTMETEVDIIDERDTQRKFTIVLEKVNNIDLSWITNLKAGFDEETRDPTGIQVLNIIMRHAAEMIHFSIGGSIYWNIGNTTPYSLGKGLCLRSGGYSSVIAGWKPYLNVDVVHKAFHSPEKVVDIMVQFQDLKAQEYYRKKQVPEEFTNKQLEEIKTFLVGLKVTYEINNSKRTYHINGLGPSADEHKFKYNGKLITIARYFANHKQYTLKCPQVPCLSVGATNREDKIYLPAELCRIIPDQFYNKMLDETQKNKMFDNVKSMDRIKKIQNAFDKINVNESDTLKREFKLSVDNNMKEVNARILSPPTLRYSGTKDISVNMGKWQMHTFKQVQHLCKHSWAILNLCENCKWTQIVELKKELIENAKSVGMDIEEPKKIKFLDNKHKENIQSFFDECKNNKLRLVIVIIPDVTDVTYGTVKRFAELIVGLLTQCIKFKTVKKIIYREHSHTTLQNICLKINAKLNGINHTFRQKPTCLNDCMLVGADVSHPLSSDFNNKKDKKPPLSIAAVAVSQDTEACQYTVELRLQQSTEEMIMDLENIITSQISIYHKKTKCLPQKIIYYRDGVSEGQLAKVMYFEIDAIRRACKKFQTYKDYKKDIEITCLVVQKRHHVRLFPKNPYNPKNNVKAGTIVDTEITHPNHIDFYLVSHASFQGIPRPTKYRCICNDSNFSDDVIEELTYYLCHMCARCTKAISYPAPTYYAHLAAYRGKVWTHQVINDISLEDLQSGHRKLNIKMAESPMYFI